MTKIRLAKYLASCGIASRRNAEDLIKNGRVEVNNQPIFEPGTTIDPDVDTIRVNGVQVKPENKVYYLLNKPTGYTTSAKDSHAERLITELIPEIPRVFPVGRLDRETEGLIIMTNDGDLTQRLTHPSFEKEKEYIAITDGELGPEQIKEILSGIKLVDGEVRADKLEKTAQNEYKIVVHIGKNRIVRRIFEHFGLNVTRLQRIRIAGLELGELQVGKYRELTKEEIGRLKNA